MLPPRVVTPTEMRIITITGLIFFLLAAATAYAFFGIWSVIAYYGIGAVVGLYVACVRDRRYFLWRGMFCRRRALSYAIVVMFLWPTEVSDAV